MKEKKKTWTHEGIEYDDYEKYWDAKQASRYLTPPPIEEDTFHRKTRTLTHTHKCPMCKAPVTNMRNFSTSKGFQDNYSCDECDWSHLSEWYR